MTTFDKTKLVNRLKRAPLKITFVKDNGKTRVMVCTLEPDAVPDISAGARLGGDTRGVLTVWGKKEKGWRSIRVKEITDVVAA